MLLDSDTSLKCAHDIIHDAFEFFTKWPCLVEDPDDTSSGDSASKGYVDFEFADGSLFRVPCAWSIFTLAEGNVRESITFRNNGFSETWSVGTVTATVGAITGLIANGPVAAGVFRTASITGLTSENNLVVLVLPSMMNFTAHAIEMLNAAIRRFIGTGTFEINNSELATLNAPDGEVILDEHIRADAVVTEDLITSGEKIIPVEKVNGWITPSDPSLAPETDATYTEYIPFEALSNNGAPINGFNLPLVDNPFYPDWIYVSSRYSPWKPDYAWVPSATMPNVPYWRDIDGIYWYKARIESNASMFGSPSFVWPMRTAIKSEGMFVNSTTPPMKMEADGLIVTVQVMGNGIAPICLTDRYDRIGDGNWLWQPGVIRTVTGPRICQFIAKRNFIWANNQIISIEYQFLPIGDMDG